MNNFDRPGQDALIQFVLVCCPAAMCESGAEFLSLGGTLIPQRLNTKFTFPKTAPLTWCLCVISFEEGCFVSG